jgi:hypothetical protein
VVLIGGLREKEEGQRTWACIVSWNPSIQTLMAFYKSRGNLFKKSKTKA